MVANFFPTEDLKKTVLSAFEWIHTCSRCYLGKKKKHIARSWQKLSASFAQNKQAVPFIVSRIRQKPAEINASLILLEKFICFAEL